MVCIIEGKVVNMTEKKIDILFVCVENSCRSQIAEGLARNLFGDKVEAYSAGSKPSGRVNPDAIKVMAEVGIDISGQRSKSFNDLPAKEFDYVITMGCEDTCPFIPAKHMLAWQIEDPKGKGIELFRQVRDKIKDKINILLTQI